MQMSSYGSGIVQLGCEYFRNKSVELGLIAKKAGHDS
jgi:hypothetical protein